MLLQTNGQFKGGASKPFLLDTLMATPKLSTFLWVISFKAKQYTSTTSPISGSNLVNPSLPQGQTLQHSNVAFPNLIFIALVF